MATKCSLWDNQSIKCGFGPENCFLKCFGVKDQSCLQSFGSIRPLNFLVGTWLKRPVELIFFPVSDVMLGYVVHNYRSRNLERISKEGRLTKSIPLRLNGSLFLQNLIPCLVCLPCTLSRKTLSWIPFSLQYIEASST